MEFDYTKILKQPVRFYTVWGVPIPFMRNGITLQQLIIGIIAMMLVVLLFILAMSNQLGWLLYLFRKGWLLISGFTLTTIWLLFSINWDKKNFFQFLIGRLLFRKGETIQVEHGELVEIPIETKITYTR